MVNCFLVHDFPCSRLELPIRVFLRTGRRHEVPREAAQGETLLRLQGLKVKSLSVLSHQDTFFLIFFFTFSSRSHIEDGIMAVLSHISLITHSLKTIDKQYV